MSEWPDGIERVPLRPEGAAWNAKAGEFFFPYDAVRETANPRGRIHEFPESTYDEAARLMSWNRELLPV